MLRHGGPWRGRGGRGRRVVAVLHRALLVLPHVAWRQIAVRLLPLRLRERREWLLLHRAERWLGKICHAVPVRHGLRVRVRGRG